MFEKPFRLLPSWAHGVMGPSESEECMLGTVRACLTSVAVQRDDVIRLYRGSSSISSTAGSGACQNHARRCGSLVTGPFSIDRQPPCGLGAVARARLHHTPSDPSGARLRPERARVGWVGDRLVRPSGPDRARSGDSGRLREPEHAGGGGPGPAVGTQQQQPVMSRRPEYERDSKWRPPV